jgi:hypothetical protein
LKKKILLLSRRAGSGFATYRKRLPISQKRKKYKLSEVYL